MGVYIKGMEMPTDGEKLYMIVFSDGKACASYKPFEWHEVVPVPPHGRLIDADALRRTMYHETFETDSPMQKWDSGCWIRYKLFERVEESVLTIIPAEREECDDA